MQSLADLWRLQANHYKILLPEQARVAFAAPPSDQQV